MAISPAKKDASPKGAGVCIQMKSLAIHPSLCDKVLQSYYELLDTLTSLWWFLPCYGNVPSAGKDLSMLPVVHLPGDLNERNITHREKRLQWPKTFTLLFLRGTDRPR